MSPTDELGAPSSHLARPGTARHSGRPDGTTRYRLGGLLLLLAGLYFVGEAWAAAGWEGRPYRWTVDAISELGVPETRYAGGEPFAATHHVVMNATFVATGLRTLLAGVVLAPFVPRRARRTVLGLTVAYGVGVVIVGLFPTGVPSTRADIHGVGAVLTIAGGSVLLLALAVSLSGRHRRLALLTLVLGLLSTGGTVCGVLEIGGFGLVERVAVYTVLLWQVLAGIAVLVSGPRTHPPV
ncbi:DUF998 domain-containing protein [Janibacter sp. DB-40]|uniref:DUF998 domain-containing protein n=1 Tax=Janibacter sp. DB-40 TaxID=3028808 RepID=UPI0024052BEF|nr:DUF998 domain-containing protein [Janibacter sp. DB-40]